MTRFRVNMPQLIELWIKHKEKIIENYKNKKKELLDSLDFARQQGFKEQRAKILDELKKFYPSDKDVDLAFHSEREYVARNTINRVVQKKLSQNDWYSGINDVDTKTANHLFKKVKAYTKKNGTALLSDFMIMFYHLEMHSEAMKVFDLATEKSPSLLWHALQIAIDGKQFASALSMIDLLRREYLNSENSFSLLYYQALALFGLGKKSEAKQIIANIVKIRPDFRSADTLLLEWDNEK